MVIHTAYGKKRISAANLTKRAKMSFGIHILRLEIKVVRLGRVHPPAVDVMVKETFQVIPIYITGFGIICVINLYT